jgi:hypothetical protein
MNIPKILQSPIINKSALAKELYPNNKEPGQQLGKKIAGKYRQKLTDSDREKIIKIFSDLFAD